MENTKKRKMPSTQSSSLTKSFLIGGGIGLGVTVLLILLMPLILLKTESPNSLATVAAAVSVFVGGGVGSFLAAKGFKESPMTSGMLSCTVILAPVALISFFVPGTLDLVNTLIIAGAILASAFTGAFLSGRLSESRKRNMKKVMKRR